MEENKTHCPICKKKIDSFYKSSCDEPFVHYNPMIGLTIYGPYSAEKKVLCSENGFLHFVFSDNDHRLVQLGVNDDSPNEVMCYDKTDYSFNEDDDCEDLPF